MKRRASTTTIVERQGGPDAAASEPLRQPNDRDESASVADRPDEMAPVQHDQMRRASADVAAGRIDTDCHGVPGAADGPCVAPAPGAATGVPSGPGGETRADGENRRTDRHGPGEPAVAPDGRPRD